MTEMCMADFQIAEIKVSDRVINCKKKFGRRNWLVRRKEPRHNYQDTTRNQTLKKRFSLY